MSSSPDVNEREQWPEHAVCARCAAPLTDAYQESPLGLRFCRDCFDKTIQDKVKERAAAIYLKGQCANCGKSLINGYRINQFGVLYCLSCSDLSPRGASGETSEKPEPLGDKKEERTLADALLLVAIIISHLLFLADIFLAGRFFHGQTFFRSLIMLDFLALLLMGIGQRSSSSRFRFWLTLLLVLAFTILIVRGISSVLS
jgi:hypothetical protein